MTERTIASADDIDLDRFIVECQTLLWAPPGTRQRLEDNGVMLSPANFYAAVPLLRDLDGTFEGGETSRRPLYNRIFDRDRAARWLRALDAFADEFDPPVAGDGATCTEFYWGNPQFSHGDAMAYYCLIRHLRPRRIVEIGSGFSTLVADAAIRRNGIGEIVCIEPYPPPFLAQIASVSEIVRQPVQEITPQAFSALLAPADILFIDSTHTVKIGSDCLYIYLVLLPSVTRRLTVHSHDIFLPFGMPLAWARERQLYWTEQYLLYAFLLNNHRARVAFGNAYAFEFLRPEAERLMRGRYTAGGGSLWFELNARRNGPIMIPAAFARWLARSLHNIAKRAGAQS